MIEKLWHRSKSFPRSFPVNDDPAGFANLFGVARLRGRRGLRQTIQQCWQHTISKMVQELGHGPELFPASGTAWDNDASSALGNR
jgi:hypothetical protein